VAVAVSLLTGAPVDALPPNASPDVTDNESPVSESLAEKAITAQVVSLIGFDQSFFSTTVITDRSRTDHSLASVVRSSRP
jgi:hypothetical protein